MERQLNSFKEILNRPAGYNYAQSDLTTVKRVRNLLSEPRRFTEFNSALEFMVKLELPKLLANSVNRLLKNLNATGSSSIDKWDFVKILYEITARASRNITFAQAALENDIVDTTLNFLDEHALRKKCTLIPTSVEATVYWMIEFLRHFYPFIEDAKKKKVPTALLFSYHYVESAAVKAKAIEVFAVVHLHDEDIPVPEFHEEDEFLEPYIELLALMLGPNHDPENKGFMAVFSETGMTAVIVEMIKSWYRSSNRFDVFRDRHNPMQWESLLKRFATLSQFSFEENFCTAACEQGIVQVLADLLSNEYVQSNHLRNSRIKKVVIYCIDTLLCIVKMDHAGKWLAADTLIRLLLSFAHSKDYNVRRKAILLISNLTCNRNDDTTKIQGIDFTADDIEFLLAICKVVPPEILIFPKFLARTGFPKVAVQELRQAMSPFEESEWVMYSKWYALTHLVFMGSLYSTHFTKEFCKEGLARPLKRIICAMTCQYQENVKEDHWPATFVLIKILEYCLVLQEYNKEFLLPGLWEKISEYANLPCIPKMNELNVRISAWNVFLAIYPDLLERMKTDPANFSLCRESFPKIIMEVDNKTYGVELITVVFTSIKTKTELKRTFGDYMVAQDIVQDIVRLFNQLIPIFPTINNYAHDLMKAQLVNINNLSFSSKEFAVEVCQKGIIKSLCASLDIYKRYDYNVVRDSDLLLLFIGIVHACSVTPACIPYIATHGVLPYLPHFFCNDRDSEARRRTWMAVCFIHKCQPDSLTPIMPQLKLDINSKTDLKFVRSLLEADAEETQLDPTEIVKLLITMGIPRQMTLYVRKGFEGKIIVPQWEAKFCDLMNLLLTLMKVAVEFTRELCQANFFKLVQQVLRNRNIKDLVRKKSLHVGSLFNILSSSILNASNDDECRAHLNNINLVSDLYDFSKAVNDRLKVQSLLTIAMMHRDEDESMLLPPTEQSSLISVLLKSLDDAIFSVERSVWGFTTKDILLGLRKLSYNEITKVILTQEGVLMDITRLLSTSVTVTEKVHGLQLLHHLCLNKENRSKVNTEQDLIGLLLKWSKKSHEEIKREVRGIVFLLERALENVLETVEKITQRKGKLKFDVFICSSEPQMSRWKTIVGRLNSAELRVAPNILTDPTTIQESACGLIDVSEIVQECRFCRAAAEYLEDLGKPLFAVHFDQDFIPKGWLARLAAGKSSFKIIDLDETSDSHIDDLVNAIRSLLQQECVGSGQGHS